MDVRIIQNIAGYKIDFQLLNKLKSAILKGDFNLLKVYKEHYKAKNHWKVRYIFNACNYPKHNKHNVICGISGGIVGASEKCEGCRNEACCNG